MPKIPINFYYGSSEYLKTIPISEGNILYNITNKQILVDEDTNRQVYSNKTSVDTKLSTTSVNPISNKVVSAEINALKTKQKTLETDLTKKGTASSNEVDEVRGQIHTNLLNPTLETTTVNGVTCTNNNDGTFTLNGTATNDQTFFRVTPWGGDNYNSEIELETGKTYKVVGCPNGGGSSTYRVTITRSSRDNVGRLAVAHDYGDGKTFVAEEGYRYECYIHPSINTPINNLLFKPMLTTDLDATYNDYVPYSGDGRLNENVAKLNSRVVKAENNITNINNTVTAINKRDAVSGKPTQCGTCGGSPLYRFHGNYVLNSNLGANQTKDIPLSTFGVTLAKNQICKVIRGSFALEDENGNQVFLPDRRKATTGMSVVGIYNNNLRIMTYGTAYNAGCNIEIDIEYVIW